MVTLPAFFMANATGIGVSCRNFRWSNPIFPLAVVALDRQIFLGHSNKESSASSILETAPAESPPLMLPRRSVSRLMRQQRDEPQMLELPRISWLRPTAAEGGSAGLQ
jgi:hypothetical protein